MKQRDLVKKLEKAGFRFDHHGGDHDIYIRGGRQGVSSEAQRNKRIISERNH